MYIAREAQHFEPLGLGVKARATKYGSFEPARAEFESPLKGDDPSWEDLFGYCLIFLYTYCHVDCSCIR